MYVLPLLRRRAVSWLCVSLRPAITAATDLRPQCAPTSFLFVAGTMFAADSERNGRLWVHDERMHDIAPRVCLSVKIPPGHLRPGPNLTNLSLNPNSHLITLTLTQTQNHISNLNPK